MALGPIPRSKIKEYGREELDLDGDALENFITMISMIDGEYMSMSSAPHPVEQAAAKDGKPTLKKRQRTTPLSARKDR